MKTSEFLATHPVFSLDEAAAALDSPRGRAGTIERLKYYLGKRRLKLLTRGIYAVVPPGVRPQQFHPDPFLTASAVRPDAVFSHHSALELMGAAHSLWRQITLYTERRRKPLCIDAFDILFLGHPRLNRSNLPDDIGTQRVERRGKVLRTTGPERTLVEGFRRPALVGGLEELIDSAIGFPTLSLSQLEEILRLYNVARLWAAVGWFLERHHKTFHVDDEYLERFEQRCPRSPQYLERKLRGGWLASRWNLILPKTLKQSVEYDGS
jgi:predicted transcriptional regulator of viral defense system